jgi:prevent-host-death family protein
MKAVGIRELKNRLSEYVRLVRAGDVVLVSDRGVVVAELRPAGTANINGSDPVVESLLRRGNVTVGGPNRSDLYPTLSSASPPGTAERLLNEERGER